MKKLRNPALALVALAVFTGFPVRQGAQQKDKPQSSPTSREKKAPTTDMKLGNSAQIDPQGDTKKLVAEAIASNIVTQKGKEFPFVAKGAGSDNPLTGGASCEPGNTQTFTHGAAIDLEGGYHVKKTETFPSGAPQEAIYSPPNADWLVQSYSRVIGSAGWTYVAADSAFPANYSFLTNSNYSSVKSNMHSFVGSLNVPGYVQVDLNTKLDTLISNISSYGYSLSGSHGTVRHTGQVWGMGVFNTQTGHAWYHGYINGTLVCAPAYLHDQQALTLRLKTWVKNVVSKLPVLMDKNLIKN
jgi:hypothetical protein